MSKPFILEHAFWAESELIRMGDLNNIKKEIDIPLSNL